MQKITLARMVLIAGLLLAMAGFAQAGGEDALYGAVAPKGSTFVRMFNGTTDNQATLQVGDKRFQAASYAATPYKFLPAGKYSLHGQGKKIAADLQGTHYYTAVLLPDRLAVIEDLPFKEHRRSMLVCYNLTSASRLDLVTASKNRKVLEGIAPLHRKERLVNPVKIRLAVVTGKGQRTETPAIVFERGKMCSLFATGNGSHPVLTWVVN